MARARRGRRSTQARVPEDQIARVHPAWHGGQGDQAEREPDVLSGSADKTLRLYEGHYHDLLNDVGKEQVMSDILSWIDKRLPRR